MQILRPGEVVRVRAQRWRIADVRSYSGCRLLVLTGVGPLNLGIERSVIVPFDVVEPLNRPPRLRIVGARRWRQTCRVLLSEQGLPDRLLTAREARIDLLPHQLEPALALLRGLASRVLIADEVGLGKTIQAGLAIAELRARGAADRVLILTPAGLREQWRDELRDRFSLDAIVVDMREARRRTAAAAVGVNPWSTVPVALASFDFVKQPEVLTAVTACRWDAVVVDEAHGAGPGTDRHRAVAALCSAASCLILLTATPHSGEPQAFASLCQLGACADDALLVFRRTRADAGVAIRRRIHRLFVQPSRSELLLHARLEELARALAAEGERGPETRLALATLYKRALSSPWSLGQSVRRRLSLLGDPAPTHTRQGSLPLDTGDDGEADDEAPLWTSRGLADPDRERRLLTALEEASRAAARDESKLGALVRLLDRLRRRNEQAIVFTEYRDTLRHVRSRLAHPCAVIHGGLTRDERRAALLDFATGRRPVLLATDAAGEGLNLHDACRVVINLELPWSPVRLEQRAGRVDRIGQRRAVHVFHLIARGSFEMRVLDRLTNRVARARRDIDVPDPLDLLPDAWATERDDVASGGPARGLSEAAAAEHARLTWARALRGRAGHRATDVDVRPLLTFTDRWRTRARLGARVLMLTETTLEDACGRTVASRLTPLLARVTGPARGASSEALSRLWRALERSARGVLDPDDAVFEEQAVRLHRAFWETRLRRECAVGARFAGAGPGPLQPGLFDRRAVHDHLSSQQARADWLADAERRATEARRAAETGTRASRVALILVP